MCDSPKTGKVRWVYNSASDKMIGIVNGLTLFQITQKCNAIELKYELECLLHNKEGIHDFFTFDRVRDCEIKANEIYLGITKAIFPSKIGEQ